MGLGIYDDMLAYLKGKKRRTPIEQSLLDKVTGAVQRQGVERAVIIPEDFDDGYAENDLLDLELEYSRQCVRDPKFLRMLEAVKDYRRLHRAVIDAYTEIGDLYGDIANLATELEEGNCWPEMDDLPKEQLDAIHREVTARLRRIGGDLAGKLGIEP